MLRVDNTNQIGVPRQRSTESEKFDYEVAISQHKKEFGNQFHQMTFLGIGDDSIVFRYLDPVSKELKVLKVYSPLQHQLGKKRTYEIVERYVKDTQRVCELLDKNPNPISSSAVVDDQTLPVHFKVVLQGVVKNDKSIIYTEGQEYIDGDNLKELIGSYSTPHPRISIRTTENGIKLVPIRDDLMRLLFAQGLYDLSNFIRDSVMVGDGTVGELFSAPNIKPRINTCKGVVEMYITDLADSIHSFYS